MRRVYWLFLLLWLVGCSGGLSGPGPEMPDAGPVPGLENNPPVVVTPVDNNAGGDPGNSLQAALNQAAPPGLPDNPPPLVPGSSPRSQRALGAVYNLAPGWNALSFPFARLTAATGFRYQLYGYSQGNFFAVDPVNNPTAVDTRLAYLAYSDAASSVSVSGESNDGQVSTVPLNQGWNLIGCPSENPLAFLSMSASQPGVTRRLDEAAGSNSSFWLDRITYGLTPDGVLTTFDLLGPGGFSPFEARWVFAFSDTELNLNPVPPVPAPLLGNLSAASVQPGDLLILTGSGFSVPADGLVTLGGIPVPGSSIQSWSANQIRLLVPTGARSGNVVVFVNRFPSNPALLTVTNSGSGTANLSGLVRASDGTPLAGAQVTLDSGQSTLTGADGTFAVSSIPAGDHLIFAQALGYKRGAGLLSFSPGDNRTLLVELSPLSGGGSSGGSGSEQQRGNLYVAAVPLVSGGSRFFVSRIEVQEYGNHSNRWNNTWFSDQGDSQYQLTCDGAYVGRSYTIRIVWSGPGGQEQVGFFYRTFYQNGQTERFYNP